MAENILQSEASKEWEWFRKATWDVTVWLLDFVKNRLMDYVLGKVEDPLEALSTGTKVLDFTTWTSTSILNDKIKEDYNKTKEQIKNLTSLKQAREVSKNLEENQRKKFEKEMMEYLKKNNPEIYKAYLKENKQIKNNIEVKPSDIEWIWLADESKVEKQVVVPNTQPDNVWVQPLTYQDRKLVKDPATWKWWYESKRTWKVEWSYDNEQLAKQAIDENLKEHYWVWIRNAILNKDDAKKQELESWMKKRWLTREQVESWLSE